MKRAPKHDDVDCCGVCGRLFPQVSNAPLGATMSCRCDDTFEVCMFEIPRCRTKSHRIADTQVSSATPKEGT